MPSKSDKAKQSQKEKTPLQLRMLESPPLISDVVDQFAGVFMDCQEKASGRSIQVVCPTNPEGAFP
jgi:hypothetical protein